MDVMLHQRRHGKLIELVWASIGPAGGELMADVLPATRAGRLAGPEIELYILEMRKYYKLAARHNERKMEDILLHLYDNNPGSLLIFETGKRTLLLGSCDPDAFASIEATRDSIVRYLSHVPGDLAVLEDNIKRFERIHLRSFGQAA